MDEPRLTNGINFVNVAKLAVKLLLKVNRLKKENSDPQPCTTLFI